jgi:hypothetical protein
VRLVLTGGVVSHLPTTFQSLMNNSYLKIVGEGGGGIKFFFHFTNF